ncbi:AAA family ATPase [Ferrovibrio xuzhouensis]|uniref:Shikimate kinase n=1 Tax=Ferrovibrio xuzhouensis TaxID=1576914 RepID=A0ABV7VPC4_9PROT
MNLIFFYGKPATGKLTVARELTALTGYKLFHNHLTVDLLLPVFDFGSPPFVELREKIWLSVFEQAAKVRLNGMIFTFAPELTVRSNFVDRVIDIVAGAGSRARFVELTCPMDEVYRRIDSQARRQTGKLTSHEVYAQLEAQGVFATSHMPKPDVLVDTSRLQPTEAAAQIMKELRLPKEEI